MNKQKIISIILIALGSFLEIFYYFNRFSGDGINPSIAIIQGVALTALLMGIFIMRGKWYVWALIILLAGYSIFNTAAGQRQSLTTKAENTVIQINDQKITDLQNSISRKRNRYSQVEELLNNSISDFEEMWEWRNTTARYEEELDLLDSEIADIEREVITLRNPEIEDSDIGKLYNFYSELVGLSAEWLQFWLQIAFSTFIAMMAPAGILLWPKPKEVVKKIVSTKKDEHWTPYVKKWVNINWIPIRNKQGDKLLSKDSFINFLMGKNFDFGTRRYDRVLKAARIAKVVDSNTIIIKDEAEAIAAIIKIIGR